MSGHADIEGRVSGYYAERLEEHGATHRGVDWSSEDSQATRFRELARAAGDLGADYSLLDWGCGYGGMLDWLRERSWTGAYTGFDVAPEMIAEAERRHAGEGVAFTTNRAALPTTDVVVASGIFNVKVGTDEAEWGEYVWSTIADMWEHTERAMAFNALTSYSDADRMESRLHYADSLALFDRAKRELSREVALHHDYGLYEFTLIVRRGAP